ncbi:MAG: TonB-dependent receptor [Candidatus Latescibacterota bacterium]
MAAKLHGVILLLLLASGVGVARAAPQSAEGVITGRVVDAETGEPVAFVNVYLDSLYIGAATGPDGLFVIRPVPPGTHRLIARHIGYAPYVQERVRAAEGGPPSHAIALYPTEVMADQVIVSATRREQTAHMAPASVSILSADDLSTRSVTTFDQALEMVPGISVQRSSGVSVQSLSIRGSSDVAGGGVGNRVLLLIDGRPALTADSGSALWSLVPTGSIDRIEVVKGAFSSLYGSTAMGGVVNVITRRPAYRAMTTVEIGSGFYEKAPPDLRYTDHRETLSQLQLSHSGRRGPVSYLLDLSRKQSDGHSENTAYQFYTGFGKVLYDIQKDRNIELSLAVNVAENDYPHTWDNNLRPLRVQPKYRDDRQTKKNYSADLLYWAVASPRAKYSSRFYFHRKAARSLFNEHDPDLQIPYNEPYGLKTVVDADKFGTLAQFDYYLNEHNVLISGLDVQVDHVHSAPDTVMFGNRGMNSAALYVQEEAELTDRLTMTAGFRYDWSHLVGADTEGQFGPKLAMVYCPRKPLALRLLLGQAFRAPSIAERFFQKELGGGTLFKPNPGLKPERMDFSLETGLRWRLGERWNVDMAYYRYHYRDMIYWEQISIEEGVDYELFQVRNLNRALMSGVEIGLDYHFNRLFRASLNYTYLDAKDQSPNRTNDLLAYRVRHSFVLSTDVRVGRFSLNVNGRYKSRMEEVFMYEYEAPDAFFVANAKLAARFGGAFRVSLAINNLLNTPYEELARYRMPGRSYMAGIGRDF